MENFEGQHFAEQAAAENKEVEKYDNPGIIELVKYFKREFLQEEGK